MLCITLKYRKESISIRELSKIKDSVIPFIFKLLLENIKFVKKIQINLKYIFDTNTNNVRNELFTHLT